LGSINLVTREINFRIVYWGPALSGKTTNLLFIYNKIAAESKGTLVTLPTTTERTLFFDFFPMELGEIQGFRTRFHLYTVPGQDYYRASRKLIVNGVDGLVFVADSQKSMNGDNLASLRDLEDTLGKQGLTLEATPTVFQYNKRDLAEVRELDVMESELNGWAKPSFPAVATTGENVIKTLRTVCRMVVENLEHKD
jgi:signal recognition particle receptor subunit beta